MRTDPIVIAFDGPLGSGKSSIIHKIIESHPQGIAKILEPYDFCLEEHDLNIEKALREASPSQIWHSLQKIDAGRIARIKEIAENPEIKIILVEKTAFGLISSGIGRKLSEVFTKTTEAMPQEGGSNISVLDKYDNERQFLSPDAVILMTRTKAQRQNALFGRDDTANEGYANSTTGNTYSAAYYTAYYSLFVLNGLRSRFKEKLKKISNDGTLEETVAKCNKHIKDLVPNS